MPVPYVDLAALHAPIRDRLLAAVARVLDHGQFILGPEVGELEGRLAELLGIRHVVGVNSGTDAILLALRLRGVGSGDEVLTVSHSFMATAAAIRLAGATPVFVDILDDTMLMDPEALERAVTPRCRAVIPVHLNGAPCDLTAIEEICRMRGLDLIEDCAQAFGAQHRGKPVGTMGIGCFSLHPLKTLSACGDGGFIAIDDDQEAARLRESRNLGLMNRDHCREVSVNSRLDSIQAAILLTKLEVVDEWIASRRRHAAAYLEAFADLDIRLPPPDGTDRSVATAFVVRHPRRDELRKRLHARGIESKIHYPLAIHQQEAFAGERPSSLPVTERVVGEILSLPCGPQLSVAERDHVISGLRDVLEELGR